VPIFAVKRVRGAATLAAFLLVLACAALSFSALAAVHVGSAEHRARGAAECARFAALAGTVLGPVADERPELVAPEVTELQVAATLDASGNCRVSARAACGSAVRFAAVAAANPAHCTP
jgi:hypothetical protein